MRRSAFTLMELLIVIAIIMILMGMVFVGIRMARSAAMKAKTVSAITDVVGFLTNYRQTNGRFPDDLATFTQFGSGVAYNAVDWTGVNLALVAALTTAGEPLKTTNGMLTDAWGQPLRYRPSRFYPYLSGATAESDGENPPARDSFQLWSIGENKIDDGGTKDATRDDISSWNK